MDERYYGDVVEAISLPASELHDEDVTLKIVETEEHTGTSYSHSPRNGNISLAFAFETDNSHSRSEIILYPNDVLEISKVDTLYNYFHKQNNQGLFIPDSIPSMEQCAMCGRYLREYSNDRFHKDEELGYIWCFEYDRSLVFHGECIHTIISRLEQKINNESDRFIASSI